MAMWKPSDNKVYLPPAPVSKVLSTDAYVSRTNIYYYAGSSRLLTVGHPYFAIRKQTGKNPIVVPKVSGYQYRVFRVRLPDPNKFGLPDASLYNPDSQRLVWACTGVEVGRGQPLGVGVSGHPLYNRLYDTENTNLYDVVPGDDTRDNLTMDYKQTQLFIIGCKPPLGEHWAKGTPCNMSNVQAGDCPPIELKSSTIQDGDMIDTGFGALDFAALQTNKSDVPLDIVTTTCKYPDFLQMAAEPYGDLMFFCLRREQMFIRHFYNRAGTMGDAIPDGFVLKGTSSTSRGTPTSSVYGSTPSGSMVTSESQLFNKPYWLQRAQGPNNGICWGNQLFVTVVDTTRSTNMTICATQTPSDTYKASNFKEYMRHGEEFDLQFIFQLCVINLTTEVMAYLHGMNATLLEDWNFGSLPPPTASLGDTYRFLQSQAISCQKPSAVPTENKDPYAGLTFWEVDLSERFSLELDQFPLGRKFLLQRGTRVRSSPVSRKRPAPSTAPSTKRKRSKRS
uniref:Major capsid protein L1 n=1 Tax=Human papillomavirus type 90 TaxID=333769 RepID=A0A7G2A836_9PAPI|nr:L1 [Human papillomavirus type 90]CAD1814461.1 L1 [Human papillomavirus type 90]CAD1814600.1 L1 [Human papillomavirus type 90]